MKSWVRPLRAASTALTARLMCSPRRRLTVTRRLAAALSTTGAVPDADAEAEAAGVGVVLEPDEVLVLVEQAARTSVPAASVAMNGLTMRWPARGRARGDKGALLFYA